MKAEMMKLVAMAREAAKLAYCPYSKFPVGAAVLAEDGGIYTGCNVENASSGLTVCAERIAVFKAVSDGKRRIKALAVAGGKETAASPCGACRQVLAEFAAPRTPVFFANLTRGEVTATTLAKLLPMSFALGKKS